MLSNVISFLNPMLGKFQGLTEKFKEKDRHYTGSATLTYEDFMATILPFLVSYS